MHKNWTKKPHKKGKKGEKNFVPEFPNLMEDEFFYQVFMRFRKMWS